MSASLIKEMETKINNMSVIYTNNILVYQNDEISKVEIKLNIEGSDPYTVFFEIRKKDKLPEKRIVVDDEKTKGDSQVGFVIYYKDKSNRTGVINKPIRIFTVSDQDSDSVLEEVFINFLLEGYMKDTMDLRVNILSKAMNK